MDTIQSGFTIQSTVFGGIDVDDGSNEMERSSVGDDRGVVRVDPTRTIVRQGVYQIIKKGGSKLGHQPTWILLNTSSPLIKLTQHINIITRNWAYNYEEQKH